MKKFLITSFLAVLVSIGFVATSQAAVFLSIERISGDTARITGSGTFDIASNNFVASGGAACCGDLGLDAFTGSMNAGTSLLEYVYVRHSGSDDFILDFDSTISMGSILDGIIVATLDVETWAAIGTTGSIFDEDTGGHLGSYEIISPVPLPAALPLFAAALIGMSFLGRRRKRMAETA